MKTIGITGGSGLVGRHLSKLLADDGYNVIVFTRNPDKKRKYIANTTYALWNPSKGQIDKESLGKIYAMVHLAGAGVADKRWTEERKKTIVRSRVKTTSFLVDQLKEHASACKTLISASAIGYYGADKGKEPFTENMPPANDFLSETCEKWEEASAPAEQFLRRVVLRIGIVLAKEGGAFKEFVKPMKFMVKPILGSGEQMVSWIHINDLVRLIRFAIERIETEGVFNAVAPKPVTHTTLMNTIAEEKKGVQIPIPVPAPLLKIALGEMSTEILKSCTVSSEKIYQRGFRYNFTYIEDAVKDLLKPKKEESKKKG